MSCKKNYKMPTPKKYLNDILNQLPKNNGKNILKKINNINELTWEQVGIIIEQLLPPVIYDKWPEVSISLPLSFPESNSFNESFSVEWYYLNGNGVTTNGDRIYFFRLLKRIGCAYNGGFENIRIFSDSFTCTIIDNNGSVTRIDKTYSVPCCINNNLPLDYTGDIVHINNFPFNITYKNKILFKIEDDMSTLSFNLELEDNGINISMDISGKCNKPILLQGKELNGLDPNSSDIISKITGTSYLYYSWPSFNINNNSYISMNTPLNNKKWYIDPLKSNMWVDHQGGVVKKPKLNILAQYSIMLGMRPNVFPGWNWFSIQFFNGEQVTFFSNKPWNNNKKYNIQRFQGTWDDKDGNLTWITGILEILEFWESPISGTNFGIKYKINFGDKGIFLLNSILKDQRVISSGREDFEGGADVFDEENKLVGYSNLECVGWPTIDERVKFALQTINIKYTSNDFKYIKNQLVTSLIGIRILISIIMCILFFIMYIINRRCKYFSKNKIHVITILTICVLIIFYIIITFFIREIGCKISNSCSKKYTHCLFKCPA